MRPIRCFPAGSSVLTVEFKINLVSPAKGERLRAAAHVIKPGRTLTVCDLKVYGVTGGKETLCATGQQTLICLANTPDRAKRVIARGNQSLRPSTRPGCFPLPVGEGGAKRRVRGYDRNFRHLFPHPK
jgi:hypothetical protein